MAAARGAWLDRLTLPWAPRWTIRRMRARVAGELLARYYDAASTGRRTQGWSRNAGDANTAIMAGAELSRIHARDLVRNNAYATSSVDTIVDHIVGWGILARPMKGTAADLATKAKAAWADWAETTDCDADGRHDFAGLQKLVMRTVVESGECLVRRRWRRPEDGLALPMQLQVLEPDYLDSSRDGLSPIPGRRVIQGIEFDPIGRRAAYHLLREHPGSSQVASAGFGIVDRIPASEVLHIYRALRPGQIRGISWFAPVVLRLKDFDEYVDASLMKQKIAADLAVFTTDVDGTSTPLGTVDPARPEIDQIEPGMVSHLASGREVHVVQPPSVSEHEAYSKTVLAEVATGLGVSYEDLTGRYDGLPYSAARMSRLRHWARVEDWRWNTIIPQFCDPAWAWAMQAAVVMALLEEAPKADWTAAPAPLIEPDREGLAYQRLNRIGAISPVEMLRERGYGDVDAVLEEIADFYRKCDALGIVLDIDPRQMTQAGQRQPPPTATAPIPRDDSPPADVPPPDAPPGDAAAAAGRNGGPHYAQV